MNCSIYSTASCINTLLASLVINNFCNISVLCHPYFSSYLRLNASHHIMLLAVQSSEAFDVLFVKSVKFCAQIEVPDVITHANFDDCRLWHLLDSEGL